MRKSSSKQNTQTGALATTESPEHFGNCDAQRMVLTKNAIREHVAVAGRGMQSLLAAVEKPTVLRNDIENHLRSAGDVIVAALQEASDLAHQLAHLTAEERMQDAMLEAEELTARLMGTDG